MGRWSEKGSTDDYYTLSTKFLKERGYFKSPGTRSGTLSWSRCGEVCSRIAMEVSIFETHGEIRFNYTSRIRSTGEKIDRDYTVHLEPTKCNYGGLRWWFACPLFKGDIVCQNLVGVLYLGSAYFGCRHCYRLVYQSSKDSHKLDRVFNEMGIHSNRERKMFIKDLKRDKND